MSRTVYLDYAATTPVDPRVTEAMLPYFTERFGNPNALYALGRETARAHEQARERVASALGAQRPDEVIFTSGGTESDNTAVIGLATAGGRTKGHLVVSAFEHHAVLDPARWLAARGFELTELKPRTDGVVHPDDLASVMRDDTVLVSIMHGNNELGTLQPLSELAEVAHAHGALLHTDAAQTVGKVPFDVRALGVDAVSITGHKVYAPKGTGALYVRNGVPLAPYLMGGGQERKRRSGTQNVAGSVALATALELMEAERAEEAPRLAALRDRIASFVLENIADARINGAEAAARLPHIVSMAFADISGEDVLLHLDHAGFEVATGSACQSGSREPSYVLLAIDCPRDIAFGAVRVSLGRHTTEEDVERFCEALAGVVEHLRRQGSRS